MPSKLGMRDKAMDIPNVEAAALCLAAVSVVCQIHSPRDSKQCVFLPIKITKNDSAIPDALTSDRMCAEGQRQLGAVNQTRLWCLLIQVPFPRGSRLWSQRPPRTCKLALILFAQESRPPLNSPGGTRL